MSHKTKIFSNSIYLLLDFAIATLLSFAFWFILGRILTPSESGIVFTSLGLSSIISVFSLFGLNTALAKLISEKQSPQKTINLIQISFKYILFSNIIAIIIVILLNQYLASLLKFSFIVTVFTALNIFALAFSNLSSAVLNGLQKMRKIFTTDFIGFTFKLISLPIFVYLGFSSIGALMSLCCAFMLIFILRAKTSWFSFKSDQGSSKILFHYAVPAFISSIASVIFSFSSLY